MSDAKTCPKCGAEVPADGPAGICPKCLLLAGMAVDSEQGATTSAAGFVPAEPETLAPQFPDLEILELLGHGGMGAVYKARQAKLDRLVALKIIRPEFAERPEFAARFHREARTLAHLNHPSIVAVYDFGEVTVADSEADESRSGTVYYFLMEYVGGTTLRQLIQAGRLQPQQALAIVPQICEALQFAHDEGVVHRDIKPENILLDRRGRVKIADFGLARLLNASPQDPTLTNANQVMGTPLYMAPEQMEGSREVDHRADIFSLGVVFYEMLTGQRPAGHFEPPSKKVQIDARLDEVVLRSMAREPERRYQQAAEVKTEVESISQGGAAKLKSVPSAAAVSGAGAAAISIGTVAPKSANRMWDGQGLGAAIRLTALHFALWAGLFAAFLAVVPKFQGLFDEFEVELPRLTLMMISVSYGLSNYWFVAVPLGMVGMAVDFAVLFLLGKVGRKFQTLAGLLMALPPLFLVSLLLVSLGLPVVKLIER